MKLEEIREQIIQQGLTEERMAAFLTCLRRVHDNWNKCQHCYLLAYAIQETDYAGAVQLIEYGYQHFTGENLTSQRFCYEHLGRAHQANGRPDLAKGCFETARALLQQKFGESEGDTFFLLRNELELTGCNWSEDLERLWEETTAGDDIIWTLRPYHLLLCMAEYLVAEHRQDEAFMQHAREEMARLLFDGERTETDAMWARHHVDSSILLSEAQQAFLTRIGLLA